MIDILKYFYLNKSCYYYLYMYKSELLLERREKRGKNKKSKKKDPIKYESNDIYKIGSYEIFLNYQIGMGSYSIVYIGRCIDNNISIKFNINKSIIKNGITINNIVAIKKIIALSQKRQKMITEEIKIMQHIKNNPHINIVTCYDVIDDLDTIYIVMEYCDSEDLSKLIGKPMKEEQVKYYFNQIINGIKYLNEYEIIHRDIKPKNLLLTDNQRILKICDFGFARHKAGLSRVYTICGSPLYMAPEIFKDKSYNDTIDIWSIGIIMYEMLYGTNPLSKIKDYNELESFMMNSTENIVIPPKKIKNGIKNRNKNVTKECINLLKTLLAKESENRITLKELYSHRWLLNSEIEEIEEIEQIEEIETINENNDDGNNFNDNGLLFNLD